MSDEEKKYGIIGFVVVGVVMLIVALLVAGGENANFNAEVTRHGAADDSTRRVWFEIENEGPEAGTANCIVKAYAPGNKFTGRDSFSQKVEVGEVHKAYVDLTIPDNMASIATESEIRCK